MPEVKDPSILRALNSGQAAPAAPVLRQVLAVPDQDKAHDNAVADAQLRNSQTQTAISGQNSQREANNNLFGHASTLRNDFYALPQVKNYATQLQSFASALKTSPTASGDQALITAYAKMLDPNSVVREGEFNTVANSDNTVGQIMARLQKEGGIDGGGMLRPEMRERLRTEMHNLVEQAGQAYHLQRDYFGSIAKRNQINPDDVIGPDLSQPYAPIFDEWNKRKDGTNTPAMVGDVPAGTQPVFGMDKPQEPFDRDAYLQKTYGVNGNQEASIVAFWNANRGNAGLTPEGIKAFYQKIGAQPPSDDLIAKGIESARKGVAFGPFDTSQGEAQYKAQLQGILDSRGADPKATLAPAAQAINGLEFGLGDEAEGVIRGAGAALMGQDPVGAYQVGRDAARLNLDQIAQEQPTASTLAGLAGGLGSALIMPGAIGGGVAGAARGGALAGGLQGFGNGRGLADSLVQGGTGAAIGGVLGAAGGKAGEFLAGRGAGGPGADVINAADDLNGRFGTDIKPIPADVGGATVRRATGVAAQLPLSASSVVNGAAKVTQEAQKARDAIALLAGSPKGLEGAGEAALAGARKFITTSRAKVNALYNKARSLGGAEPVDLTEARKVLDQNIAELQNVPGGSKGLSRLQELRAQLDQPYPVEGVRQMRTQLRDEFMGDGLRGSDLERRVGQVLDAADQDIVTGLNSAGKGDAARAYAEAAQAHAERVGVIDNILAPIIGAKEAAPKSGEQIMVAIETATQKHNARLGKFLSSLPAEDAATVRATLISRLGNGSKGTQNAEGNAFSLPQFLTHWNTMTPEAKATMFGGELRHALDNLAKVAQGTKEAQKFGNFSNTGSVVGALATGGGASQIATHPVIAIGGMLGQFGAGKLLASPAFARWLAKVPASNPGAIKAHIAALSRIAANDNAISGDLTGLARTLSQAFGMPSNIAANPAVSAPAPTGETGTGTPRQ